MVSRLDHCIQIRGFHCIQIRGFHYIQIRGFHCISSVVTVAVCLVSKCVEERWAVGTTNVLLHATLVREKGGREREREVRVIYCRTVLPLHPDC